MALTFACALAPALARAGVAGLAVDPERVDFDAVTVGVPTDPATITVRNDGRAPITLADVAADGEVTVDRRGLDHDLAPGEATRFQLTLVAAATGPRVGHVYVQLQGMAAPAAVILVTADATPAAAGVTVGCCVGPPRPPSWWLLPAAVVAAALSLLIRRRGART